jgi:hypothetical protein
LHVRPVEKGSDGLQGTVHPLMTAFIMAVAANFELKFSGWDHQTQIAVLFWHYQAVISKLV